MENFKLAQDIKDGIIPPLTIDLKMPLLPHEYVSSSFCFLMEKTLVLDEMGVGKTLTSLGACKLISKNALTKVVVFCPGSIFSQWSEAIQNFLGWKIIIVGGDKSHREAQYSYFNELQENVVLITSYSIPLHDEKQMFTLNPTCVILDEATFVKNPESKIHKFIKIFTEKVQYLMLLTGTPITLTLGDIYWLFSILHIPNVVSSYEDEILPFLEVKVIKGFNRNKIIGASGFSEFTDKISPYCIRRSLEDVLDVDSEDPKTKFISEKPHLSVVPLKYDINQAQFFQELKKEANRLAREGHYKPLRMYQKRNFYLIF